jgi:hypothetical protein
MTGKSTRRQEKPETFRQAQYWQKVKSKYLAAGLCNGCAGQAAYGHQLGFARIQDPCDVCLMTALPQDMIEKHGVWGQRWLVGHFIRGVD